ncbi:hypothetical protein DIPPA_18301 [Diplonema papillatum]|nr:hypothetical protein DIPPA_18301 [Diplonema papillatum]
MSTEEADDAPLEAATADETPAEDDEDISLPASGSLFKPEHRAEVIEISPALEGSELAYGSVRNLRSVPCFGVLMSRKASQPSSVYTTKTCTS